jgi:Uma2 family endonuclease
VSEPAASLVSRTDYLLHERDHDIRHEWVGGRLWVMTGSSGRHNRIAGNLHHALFDAARRGGCRLYMSDMKVVTDAAGYYPDVMVVCDPLEPGSHHEERPCLIAEVLSPSTADRDRREKWAVYQRIASLRHFLIVRQDDTQIEHWFRIGEDGPWNDELLGPSDALTLRCPEVTIRVADVYESI